MVNCRDMNDPWVISQIWKHVLFLNYKVDPFLIEGALPDGLKLDTFEGCAFLSVVPFRMEGIRFPFTPRLPFSSLWELNLRTYVTYKGRPGIYFFTLDTDHLLSEWVAKSFFHLPYRYRSIRGSVHNGLYSFEALGSLVLEARVSNTPLAVQALDEWLVERYSLYTVQKVGASEILWRGDVSHEPWPLNYVHIDSLEEGLCQEFFPAAPVELVSRLYCRELPVFFKPFQKLS